MPEICNYASGNPETSGTASGDAEQVRRKYTMNYIRRVVLKGNYKY